MNPPTFTERPAAARVPRRPQPVAATKPLPIDADRRGGRRQALGAVGLLMFPGSAVTNTPARGLQVLVTNVSAGGIAFRAPAALRAGTVASFRIGSGPLNLAGTVRVVRSRQRDDLTYDVGAEFA